MRGATSYLNAPCKATSALPFDIGVFLVVLGLTGPPTHADTAPIPEDDPNNPVTMTAAPLPTTQINGVAWSQAILGNTVYVGGNFSNARPPGAAPGVDTVPRANLLGEA